MLIVLEQESPLHLTAHAPHRRRRQHALRRATRSHIDVHARVGSRRGDHACHIAIAKQRNPRAGLAGLGDEFLVARPVEDAGDQIGDIAPLAAGEAAQVALRCAVDIDDPGRQAALAQTLRSSGKGKPSRTPWAAILDRHTVIDMSVQDPPLDQVIARVFEEGGRDTRKSLVL